MTSKVYFTSNTARQTEKKINDNFDDLESRTEALEAKTHTSDFTNDGSGTEFEEVSGYSTFTTTSDYVGYYVLVDTTYTKVTSSNKDSLNITAGTTKAYQYSPYATHDYVEKNGGKIDSISVNNVTQTIDANKNVNITVPVTASDVGALPDSTKYGASLSLTINSSTFVITAQLKDQDNNNLGTAQTIDLPLESVVVSGSYDSATKKVILTLQNGSTIEFSVADLISGLQTEITSSNKLSADLVDDTNTTHKFTSASEKSTWNAKQDALSAGDHITINGTTISGEEGITTVENDDFYVHSSNSGVYRWKPTNATLHIGNLTQSFTGPFEAIVIIGDDANSAKQFTLIGANNTNIYYGNCGSSASSIGHIYTYAIAQILQKTDVVDNLTSSSTTAPLSAKQGKELNTNKQDKYSTLSFTASDAGWSSADSDGFYTLTITSAKKPIICFDTNGEQIMAGLKSDGTNIYVIADAKFAGSVLAF